MIILPIESVLSPRETPDPNQEGLSSDDSVLIEHLKVAETENIQDATIRLSPVTQPRSTLERITKIIAADDQLINLEVLKYQMSEIGIADKCLYCIDGQAVIDKAKSVL